MIAPVPQPEDWDCPVCAAKPRAPVATCRRCGCDLLPFARLRASARRLAESGYDEQAAVLSPRFGAR